MVQLLSRMLNPVEPMTPLAQHAIALVINVEGGAMFTDDPADPGGATRWGITRATLSSYLKRPVPAAAVETLSRSVAEAIYIADYWNPIRGDELNPGVALMAFDTAVNQGVGTNIRFLQSACSVMPDGVFGPVTLAAVNAWNPAELIQHIATARLVRYKTSPNWPRFGAGWTNRVNLVTTTSLNWSKTSSPNGHDALTAAASGS